MENLINTSKIVYIYRKPNPKYKSREGIFAQIENEMSLHINTSNIKLKYEGGRINVIYKNIKNLNRTIDTIYHITGDVHYMAMINGRNSVHTMHDVYSVVKGGFFKKF